MKKTIMIIIGILAIYYVIGATSSKVIRIPDESIRFRVIPNSNEQQDQDIKLQVRDEVETYISSILHGVDNIDVSRTVISSNLTNISNKIDNVLERENYTLPYKVNFGLNYFPAKEFKGIEYKEGYYESLVITLGKGEGDNWWCVLFPPLCLIEAEEGTDIEYTSYVKEMLDRYV